MAAVLDSSAVLTLLLREPGQEVVRGALIAGAIVCTMNLAEVATVLARKGVPVSEVRSTVVQLPVRVVDLDLDLAIRGGEMTPTTKPRGLSLGDRVCLALAVRERVPAITADRAWQAVATPLGVQVKLVR